MMRCKGKETMEEGGWNQPKLLGSEHLLKGINPKDVAMDSNGIQIVIMGRISQFGCLVCHSLNSSMGKPFGIILVHLGVHRRWINLSIFLWWLDRHQSSIDSLTIWSKCEGQLMQKCISQRNIGCTEKHI
jgi:hypothetical protein